MDGEAIALVCLALAKWVTYCGLIGLTGAVAARGLLIRCGPTDSDTVVERALLLLATYAGGVLILAAVARLYAQTYSVFGLDGPVTMELLHVIGIESRWGRLWQPQAGVALLAGAAAIAARGRTLLGWRIIGVSTVLLWMTLPSTGHAVSFGTYVPWFLQAFHGLAAGLWTGTLVAILLVVSPLVDSDDGNEQFANLIRRFSPLAMAAVAALFLTGGLTTWYYIDTPSQLWSTTYGRTLLLKVGLVVATGTVGVYNWRRQTPRLGTVAGVGALRWSIRVEVAFALTLLGATAVLVHLAMPDELG